MKGPARYFAVSNVVSYASLLSGLGAAFCAQKLQSWELAGLFIALSALADTFDGKFARRFPRTRDEVSFGVQLDSLVDAVTFGVVPVICLNALLRLDSAILSVLWAGAATLYVLGALTRLGFYNLHHDADSGFVGLPTTLAGLLWSTFFLAHPDAIFTIPLLAGLGLAMVSRLPVPRPRGATMLAYMLWLGLVSATHIFLLQRSL